MKYLLLILIVMTSLSYGSTDCEKLETKVIGYYDELIMVDRYLEVFCDDKKIKRVDVNYKNKEKLKGETYRELILDGYVIKKCVKTHEACEWEKI